MKRNITREQAIDEAVCLISFREEEAGTPAFEFYVRNLQENTDCVYDIDRYAHLNTLFGYDIGWEAAMEIDYWMWSPEINGIGEIETGELSYKDKEVLMKANEVLNLKLSFDKFRTNDFECYEYF